jgi:membrane protein required for colicin V production
VSLDAIGWVDAALLALLLVSVVVGLWRGLLFEVMSLAGWIAAYVCAQVFGAQLAPYLPVGAPGSALQVAAAFVIVFVVALIVWGLLSALLRRLIQASPLSGLDRLLGGAFGLLRGVLIALVVVTVVQLTPLAKSPSWQASQGAVGLQTLLAGVRPWLPADIVRHLPA